MIRGAFFIDTSVHFLQVDLKLDVAVESGDRMFLLIS
jgi:hypothetical protein